MKEVKADAEELGDELLHGVPDVSHHMLKVWFVSAFVLSLLIGTLNQMLRSFQDTMAKVCLEDSQECAICLEVLKPRECQRFALAS